MHFRITDIKYNSPAHISGKIEDGDEIIQINYQTVVGWHYKRVLQQLQESPPDVLLTLKKRPRHTKIYGQIYLKPYRLPSKKQNLPYRFGENLPSPRIELIPTQDFSLLPLLTEKSALSDSDSSSSNSILMPVESSQSSEKDHRLFLPKPRAVLQRRNTICGDQASGFRGNITFWHEMSIRRNMLGNLRDKSISVGFGLEMSSILPGGTKNSDKYAELGTNTKGSLPDIKTPNENGIKTISKSNDVNDNTISQPESDLLADENRKKKVVKFITQDSAEKLSEIAPNESQIELTTTSSEWNSSRKEMCDGLAEAINVTLIKDKDVESKKSDDLLDKPPRIGPRKEFLKIAPKPPPRPSKAAELVQRKFEKLKQERTTHSPSVTECASSEIAAKHITKDLNTNDNKSADVPSLSPTSPENLARGDTNSSLPLVHTKPMIPKSTNSEDCGEESELLTPNKTKTLTLKKKNSIYAKRRRICLKSLELSDIQGHLYRRTKDKNGFTYWAKLYFVLVETVLYGFRNKKSQKANCLIFLPGFTISLAKEVHSKPFAYKVYHPQKTFYFAAESEQALLQWMEYIKRATLKVGHVSIDAANASERVDNRDLFSETDTSDDENDTTIQNIIQPSLFKSSFLSAMKKRASIDYTPASSITQPKSDRYHLSFGSLKKLTNFHNLAFSTNKSERERDEKKKIQNDIPVPTAHFKSYRKIPGNAGMQLGSNSIISTDYNTMHNIQRPQQCFMPTATSPDQISINETDSSPATQSIKKDISLQEPHTNAISQTKTYELSQPIAKKMSKNKTMPFNYMHASNPNLVEFSFQTSKIDVGLPKLSASNNFDQHQNLQGFVTLKDLMLQREEDEAHNMYNNRVNLGVEKTSDRQTKRKTRHPSEVKVQDSNRPNDDAENSSHGGPRAIVNKIQQRSLPKTPDYAQSFKTDDTEIILARSKEGRKLRDFGYEFISGDEVTNQDSKPAMLAKSIDRLPAKRKGLNWIGLNLDNEKISKGSFKIIKQKHMGDINDIKRDGVNENIPLSSTSFHQNDAANCSIGSNDERKRSATNATSCLSKLNFPSSKTVKEKRLLGSPRLHRAASSIFGRKPLDYSFSLEQSKIETPPTNAVGNSSVLADIDRSETIFIPLISSSSNLPDLPPVFVPETYSLRDPNTTK